MEFDAYPAYADDDHHIDLRNPHFRREPYNAFAGHHYAHPDIYSHHTQHPSFAQHLAGLAVDVKPRLTKEQHDILESHYQQQNKPNTQTKKSFAEALGVSLDKVNNWFQNRRAKSKQDAKKAAGSGTSQSISSQPPSLQLSTHDLDSQFLSSEYFTTHNDSAVSVDPMALTNGLGLNRTDSSSSQATATMSPQDLLSPAAKKLMPVIEDIDTNRRTLTQDDFDTFAHGGDYVPEQIAEKKEETSPEENHELLNEYFPELGTFSFDNTLDNDVLGSTEMQPAFSTDSFESSSSVVSEAQTGSSIHSTSDSTAQRHPSAHSTMSDWSDHSTPSLSLTPAAQQTDSVFNPDEIDISPRGKVPVSTSTWQPGQSVPVDYDQMDREFREAALRSATQNTSGPHTRRNSSDAFNEQAMSFPNDNSFPTGENSSSLTQSLHNMEISQTSRSHRTLRNQSSMTSLSGSGGIAARRQRPRPQPLSSGSLRSTSYCGALPTSTGIPAQQQQTTGFAPTAQSLRRIKSSNVMHSGFASGRIQKNIGGQRSPLNFTFADAMNSPKFARSVSGYSPAGAMMVGNSNLAPHTPLSPSEMPGARIDFQRQLQQYQQQSQAMSRQQSMETAIDENGMLSTGIHSNTFTSPPSTPVYGHQFNRNRLGMLNENTPPQSAPATQQCFPGQMFPQAPQMQASLSTGHMLQSQTPASYMMSANEYPQMPNMVMPSQPMHAGQYLDMMAAQGYGSMGQMVHASQPMNMNYGNMQYGMNGQQITPPNSQYPYVPSNNGILLSQQQHQQAQFAQAKNMQPSADFFVHEYSPPQDVKREQTPRKAADHAPKNYTFANHGPEHFEKSKIKDLTGSPGSLSGASSSG